MSVVLFVDDMSERFVAYRKANPQVPTHYAPNADEAILQLSTAPEPYMALFLDHDMCEEDYDDQNRLGQGTRLANWIVEHKELVGDPIIICHSLNHAGRIRMCGILGPHFTKVWDAAGQWNAKVEVEV